MCHLWLKLLGRCDWIHHFVLRSEAELDEEFRGWMREAYDVGRQADLTR